MEKFLNLKGLEYVFGKIRSDLSRKQAVLKGQPGQVVGYDAAGSAIAQNGWSNPNLLDNWYFAAPINQRGQTEYAESYAIDRWRGWQLDDGLRIVGGGIQVKGAWYQYFPSEFISWTPNKLFTISILTLDGQMAARTFRTEPQGCYTAGLAFPDGNLFVEIVVGNEGGNGAYQFYLRMRWDNVSVWSPTILATKLELGPVQTLAYQDDSGRWGLNDFPPDPTLELLKCQRYLARFGQYDVFTCIAAGNAYSDFIVQLPAAIRSTPTLIGGENLNLKEPGVAWYNRYTSQLLLRSKDTNYVGGSIMCAGSIYFSCEL